MLNYSNPIIITSSEIYKRKDSKEISNLLYLLKKKIRNFHNNWNNFHTLNSSLNEVGLQYLNNFKPITENDLINNFGVYFINIPNNKPNIKKIINIKLLNYFSMQSNVPRVIIEQNNGIIDNNKNFYKSFNYINLPNCAFFESNGTYLNTEGLFKKNIKVIKTMKQTKEDWQIFKKIFFYSKKINFMSNSKYNNIIHFNCNSNHKFKNFINFLYYPTNSLSNTDFNINYNRLNYNIFFETPFKISKNKIYNTQLRLRISDFYIGGNDLYSKYSLTMVKCSKLFRLTATNFNYLF